MEVDLPPAEAVRFYHEAMQKRGWPAGKILSNANQSLLVLSRQGDRLLLKADVKGGSTRLVIACFRNPEKQTGPPGVAGLPGRDDAGARPVPKTDTPGRPAAGALSPYRPAGLPPSAPVADHRLILYLSEIGADDSLELDQPVVIRFSQPVDPVFFDFAITPEKIRWAARWSSDFKRVVLEPETTVAPGQPLKLTAAVLGGPAIERTIRFRRPAPERQLLFDLNSGRIDLNQAARYRLHSLFIPSRVPEIYRPGRALPSATPMLEMVARDFDRLDASTQRELEPFFLSPLDPQSYWHTTFQKKTASLRSRLFPDLVSPAGAESFSLVREVYTTENGHDLVLYGMREQAGTVRLAHHLLKTKRIYERFRELLAVDVPLTEANQIGVFIFDNLIEPGDDPDEEPQEPFGFFFRDWKRKGEPTICISAGRCTRENILGATLSHELFHAFQKAFTYNYATWLAESTAVWSEHYIDGTWNTEQEYIPDVFETGMARTVKLDSDSRFGPYGLYLFPYFLTEVTPKDRLVIRRIWQNCNDTSSAIEAVKKALGGGFDAVWKKFSLATLDVNPKDKSVPDQVGQFGGSAPLAFRKAHGFRTIKLNSRGSGAGEVVLGGIQTAYLEVLNDLHGPTAPAIRIDLSPFQPYVGRVSVQSILYFRDGRREYEDWSSREERLFCLNKPAENFKRIYIAVGCSDDKLSLAETLSISPEPTSRCYSGALMLTRTFEEREELETTRAIAAYTTETQSRHAAGSRSVTLHLDLDLKEKLLPEQVASLDLMESRLKDVDPDRVRKVRKAMEDLIKTPQARRDEKTGLMKIAFRVKSCRIASAGGAYRSRSEGARSDLNGIVEQWETHFARQWTGTGLDEDTRGRIERGHIKAEIYYDPESGVIQWVYVPQLDIDMHITETARGFHRRRAQNGYKTTPKSSNRSKDASFQMTFSSGGKAGKGLPMDPVWRARHGTGLSASGRGRLESPIDQVYSEPTKKGTRKGMLTEIFEWSLHLSDAPGGMQ